MDSPFQETEHMVKNILHFAITDTMFLRVIRGVIGPGMLPGEVAPTILRIIYDYYDGCPDRVAPDKFFPDEVQDAIRSGQIQKDEEPKVLGYLKVLNEVSGDNKDYVLRRIHKFAQLRALSEAAVELGKKCRRSDLEGAREVAVEALRSGIEEFNVGVDFFSEKSIKERALWYRGKTNYLMPFGIEPFDRTGAYLRRKSFILIMGQEKRGKTWAGVHFGRVGLLRGMNVVHVSHESGITERDLAERYEMNLTGVGASFKENGWRHETPILKRIGKGVIELFKKEIVPGTVRNRGKVKTALSATEAWGGKLIIKEFPRGSCSMARLNSYLNGLEVTTGFVPDVIINDYPDIMELPKELEYRHRIDKIYQDHARLGHERNCLVVGFSQVPQRAYDKKYITMSDFAEAKSKAAHCDLALAICKTKEEEKQGKVRLICVVDRFFSMEKKQAGLIQDYHIGQFCKKAYSMGELKEEEGEENDKKSVN